MINREIPPSVGDSDETVTPIATTPSTDFFAIPRRYPTYRWWRPIVESITFLVLYAIFSAIVLVANILVLGRTINGGDDPFFDSSDDMRDPSSFSFAMLGLIVMIPAVFAAIGMIGKRPIGSILSIWGRFRLRLFVQVMGLSIAIFSVMVLVTLLTQPVYDPHFNGRALFLLACILLLVPFQAAAEEIVFRGFLGQTIGSWTCSPVLAILLPAPLFVMVHGYNWVGLISIATFAVCAGFLAWATGGLEAPIAVHVVNNIVALGLGAFGIVDASATDFNGASTLLSVGTLLAVTVAILIYVNRSDRREGLGVPCLKYSRHLS